MEQHPIYFICESPLLRLKMKGALEFFASTKLTLMFHFSMNKKNPQVGADIFHPAKLLFKGFSEGAFGVVQFGFSRLKTLQLQFVG